MKTAIGEWYKGEEITQAQAEQKLQACAGIDNANDRYWMLEEWDYNRQNPEADYKKYAKFLDAVETGKNLQSVASEYLKHGVSKETLSSQITT